VIRVVHDQHLANLHVQELSTPCGNILFEYTETNQKFR